MKYSTEWHGHKIEWEFFAMKKKLRFLINDRLFIDGREFENQDTKIRLAGSHKTTFEHEGREVPVELYARTGLIGLLAIIKVDKEEISRKYVPVWRMEKWFIHYLTSFFVSLLALAIICVVAFYILAFPFSGMKPVLFLPRLNLKEVPGVIYSTDTLGNVFAFEPSTGKRDIVYSNDSMAVRDISSDTKSILLVHPKRFDKDETPLRKVFWLTLDDGEMRLLGEWPMKHSYASFTPDGRHAYFSIDDSSGKRSVVVDTLSNIDTLDIVIYQPSPSGNYFLGKKNPRTGGALYLRDIANDEATELDVEIFPKKTIAKWWDNNTVVLWTYHRETSEQIILVDMKSFESETLDFPNSYAYIPYRSCEKRIVVFNKTHKTTIGYIHIDEYEVHDRENLLWKTEAYSSSILTMLSPGGSYLLIESNPNLFGDYTNREYRIIGADGTSKALPLGRRILLWK